MSAPQHASLMQLSATRMVAVSKLIFTEPLIDSLREDKKKLERAHGEEREQLLQKILQIRLSHDRMMATLSVEFLGPQKLLEAVKTVRVLEYDFLCYCRACSGTFGAPANPFRCHTHICPVFLSLVDELHNHQLTFWCLRGTDGVIIEDPIPVSVDGIAVEPPPALLVEDYDPSPSVFPREDIDPHDVHLVFARVGDAYDFKYGKKLHLADSPFHPELSKIGRLINTLKGQYLPGQ